MGDNEAMTPFSGAIMMKGGTTKQLLVALAAGCLLLGSIGALTENSPGAPNPSSPCPPGAAPSRVAIRGGIFLMGAEQGFPDERPPHRVRVRAFVMDAKEVTVGQFASFVRATSYRTEAERFGWSGVFDLAVQAWTRRDGATWNHPEGPDSGAPPEEPVTQVSWNDAATYCRWSGGRLPTEAEWEFAARGGLEGKRYAWGDDLRPGGRPVANWWQGHFPDHDTAEDGFAGRAPVASFPPNGYGLYDVAGNVWEWCADRYGPYAVAQGESVDPRGPAEGTDRVMRGGSWMCSENFCSRYRVAARSHATPDTGLNNLGFRCAVDATAPSVPPAAARPVP
jgi:formylglycine-generating enzyme required for sulfatase activity